MKNRRIILIISIILIILLVAVGGTFAYLTWVSTNAQKTNVTFTVKEDFSCSADAGGNISTENVILAPTDCDNSEYVLKRVIHTNVTSDSNITIDMNLQLVVDKFGQGEQSGALTLWYSDNFNYVLTKNANSCKTDVVSRGSFKYTYTVDLLNGVSYTGTQDDTYYLYIWLDKAETNSAYMNASFSGHLEGDCAISTEQKAYLTSLSGTNTYFKEDAYKTKITSIDFVNYIDTTGAVKTYDLGTNPELPITGWLIKESGSDTYKLYIGSESQIYVTNLSNAFSLMTSLKTINFSNINTSELKNMEATFARCYDLTTIDWGPNFNTSNVSSMFGTFAYCGSLTSLDLSNWDTSNVTDMKQLFGSCSNLTSLNVSNWDTSNVANMGMMFSGCSVLTSLNVSNFDTSNVTNMNFMFSSMHNVTSLDLSNFDTSNVTNMGGMFFNDDILTNIYVSELWDTTNVTSSSYMFMNSPNLPNFDSSVVDITNAHYNTGGYLTYKAHS